MQIAECLPRWSIKKSSKKAYAVASVIHACRLMAFLLNASAMIVIFLDESAFDATITERAILGRFRYTRRSTGSPDAEALSGHNRGSDVGVVAERTAAREVVRYLWSRDLY